MSSKNVYCIVTAENCGHCKAMRRPTLEKKDTQKTIQGGHSWSVGFFKKLLLGKVDIDGDGTPDPVYRVYNVHFAYIGDESLERASITEFILDKENDTVRMKQYESAKGLAPDSIVQYVVMYPSFCVFEGESWDKDILEGTKDLFGSVMNRSVGSIIHNRERVYGVIRNGDHPFGQVPDKFGVDMLDSSFERPTHGPQDPKVAPGLSDYEKILSTRYKDALKEHNKGNGGSPPGSPKRDRDIELDLE